MEWVNNYIGLPFAAHGRSRCGVDCWGLVRLVYQEQKGIILPSYADDYESPNDFRSIGAIVPREAEKWEKVEPGCEQPFDVIILRMLGAPMHIGVVADPRHMLHIYEGETSVRVQYTRPEWVSRRIGFYRYRDLI